MIEDKIEELTNVAINLHIGTDKETNSKKYHQESPSKGGECHLGREVTTPMKQTLLFLIDVMKVKGHLLKTRYLFQVLKVSG